jgi:hypothetical protein
METDALDTAEVSGGWAGGEQGAERTGSRARAWHFVDHPL